MMKKKAVFLIVMLLVLGGLFPLKSPASVRADSSQGTYKKITLQHGGNVTVQIYNILTNQCGGSAWVFIRPPGGGQTSQELFPEILNHIGATTDINNLTAGTELLFALYPGRDDICRKQLTGWDTNTNPPTPTYSPNPFQYVYYSDGLSNDPYTTNPNGNIYYSHARVVTPPYATDFWRVDFEDLPAWWPPDYNYEDLSLVVKMQGIQTPDYHQNDPRWSSQTYANTSATLGQTGSGITAATVITNYYGAFAIAPDLLDTCMKRADVSGYLRPAEDPNCAGSGNAACMAGSLRWTRVGACLDPSNPQNSPFLTRFDSKNELGGWADDPTTNRQVIADKAAFKRIIDYDLAHNRPVILELNSPNGQSSGVHYVMAVATSIKQVGGVMVPTYDILDPWCNTWNTADPTNPVCTSNRTTLYDYGILLTNNNPDLPGIVRFIPIVATDQTPRKFLVIDSLPPAPGQPPADFYIIDPQGRRTGKSAVTGALFNDIPHSGYYFQRPLADDTPGSSTKLGQGMNELYIVDPVPGNYFLYVQGTPGVNYNIDFLYETNDSNNVPLVQSNLQQGTVAPTGSVRFGVDVTETAPPVFTDPTPVDPNNPQWKSFFYLPLNGWRFK